MNGEWKTPQIILPSTNGFNANIQNPLPGYLDNNNNNTNVIYNTYNVDSIKGIVENNEVNNLLFSNVNINTIQQTIRYKIYKQTNNIIEYPSKDNLFIIMRSILLQYGNLHATDPYIEIKRLNELIINECVRKIRNEMLNYSHYINDINKPVMPMELPQYVNKNNFTFDMTNI